MSQLDIFDVLAPVDDIAEPRLPRFAERPRELIDFVSKRVGASGWARVTTRQIAEHLHCSMTTARKDVASLERAGRIIVDYARDESGGVDGFKIRLVAPTKAKRR